MRQRVLVKLAAAVAVAASLLLSTAGGGSLRRRCPGPRSPRPRRIGRRRTGDTNSKLPKEMDAIRVDESRSSSSSRRSGGPASRSTIAWAASTLPGADRGPWRRCAERRPAFTGAGRSGQASTAPGERQQPGLGAVARPRGGHPVVEGHGHPCRPKRGVQQRHRHPAHRHPGWGWLRRPALGAPWPSSTARSTSSGRRSSARRAASTARRSPGGQPRSGRRAATARHRPGWPTRGRAPGWRVLSLGAAGPGPPGCADDPVGIRCSLSP